MAATAAVQRPSGITPFPSKPADVRELQMCVKMDIIRRVKNWGLHPVAATISIPATFIHFMRPPSHSPVKCWFFISTKNGRRIDSKIFSFVAQTSSSFFPDPTKIVTLVSALVLSFTNPINLIRKKQLLWVSLFIRRQQRTNATGERAKEGEKLRIESIKPGDGVLRLPSLLPIDIHEFFPTYIRFSNIIDTAAALAYCPPSHTSPHKKKNEFDAIYRKTKITTRKTEDVGTHEIISKLK